MHNIAQCNTEGEDANTRVHSIPHLLTPPHMPPSEAHCSSEADNTWLAPLKRTAFVIKYPLSLAWKQLDNISPIDHFAMGRVGGDGEPGGGEGKGGMDGGGGI